MLINTLEKLMEANGYNKNTLAKESGIPYTTIVGFYTKGTDNVKLSTLRKLADFFGVTLDYLIDNEVNKKTPPPLTAEENNLINQYRELNTTGQKMLIEQATMMTASGLYKKSDNITFMAARNGNPPGELPENPDAFPDAPDTI